MSETTYEVAVTRTTYYRVDATGPAEALNRVLFEEPGVEEIDVETIGHAVHEAVSGRS